LLSLHPEQRSVAVALLTTTRQNTGAVRKSVNLTIDVVGMDNNRCTPRCYNWLLTVMVGQDMLFNFDFVRLHRTQIGMFRPIRMDHTNCLQVAIKTLQFNSYPKHAYLGQIKHFSRFPF
jgi:hypothetical protein